MSDQQPHQRQSHRLKNYDYVQPGLYFVTICTHQRHCLFGSVHRGSMQINPAGLMIKKSWQTLPVRFPFVELDDFIVMPNHLHGLLQITREALGGEGEGQGEREGRTQGSPLRVLPEPWRHPIGTERGSLGRIVQAFKSITTQQYIAGVKQESWLAFEGKIWQRNYYDHIVSDRAALNTIRHYIIANPLQWETDEQNLRIINTA